VQEAADLGDGQAAGQRGLDLAIAVPGFPGALPFWRCRRIRGCFGLGGFVAQAGAVTRGGSFHRVSEVVQQMPAVSDLDGERSAACGAL
jgi:hypothetical protein